MSKKKLSGKEGAIEVANPGPVPYMSIPVPADGGVVQLLGPNGCGKSSVLEAVDSLVTGQGRPTVRDGAPLAEVSAFGATLRVGRRLSRLGELEISSLEGFTIADIVDPKLKDPEAADAKRIKSLLRLTDAKSNVEQFYPLLGAQEDFEFYVNTKSLATDDIVEMAGAIKRDLEKAARTQTEVATKESSQAEACRLSAADVDTTLPDDATQLSIAYQAATNLQATLQANARAYADAEKRAADARVSLGQVRDSYKGKSVAEAEPEAIEADANLHNCQCTVNDLKKQLVAAETELESSKHRKELADNALREAGAYEMSTAAFEDTINASLPDKVTEAQLAEAESGVKLALGAVEQGVLVRKAKLDLQNSLAHKKTAIAAELESDRLREAARSTETVLSEAVESLGVPLKVFDSRLVTTATDRASGMEVFEDLSEGEQWKLVTEIAIKAVGPGGIVVIPQEAWQSLDQDNRRIIHDTVRGTKVVILTAQWDSSVDEITSEVFDPYKLEE